LIGNARPGLDRFVFPPVEIRATYATLMFTDGRFTDGVHPIKDSQMCDTTVQIEANPLGRAIEASEWIAELRRQLATLPDGRVHLTIEAGRVTRVRTEFKATASLDPNSIRLPDPFGRA
jgi:hypothetical protein